jgi:hypothetical protein
MGAAMKKTAISIAVVAWLIMGWISAAFAQTLPVKIAEIWYPQSRLASSISVTTSSAATALPTPGSVAYVCNTGSTAAIIAFGNSSVTASATGPSQLAANTCWGYDLNFTQGLLSTYIAAVTATGSTTLTVEAGQGTPPLSISSSGGGGGGNVTIVQGGNTATVSSSGTLNVSAGAATTGGSATLAVTGSSSSVALPVAPSGSPSLRLVNNGPSDLFYNTGVGSATATTTPSATNQKLQACHSVIVNQGAATFIAAITATGATELDVYQDTAPVMLAGNCANVAVSLQVGTGTTMQSAATGNGSGTAMPITVPGYALVDAVCSITCSGGTTINFEGNTVATATYSVVQGYPIGGGPCATSTQSGGRWFVPTAGLANLEAVISSYSAGTITVTGYQIGGAVPFNCLSAAGALSLESTQQSVLSAIGATGAVNPGTAANWGIGANGATIPANSRLEGCIALSTEQAAVTTGDLTPIPCGLDGKLIVLPYAGKEQAVKGTTSAMTGTTSTQLIAAVASNKIYLQTLVCGNSHATVGTFVDVQDGSAGTVLATVPAAPNYGGATVKFDPPIPTTNGNGVFVVDETTGASVKCTGSGYSGL